MGSAFGANRFTEPCALIGSAGPPLGVNVHVSRDRPGHFRTCAHFSAAFPRLRSFVIGWRRSGHLTEHPSQDGAHDHRDPKKRTSTELEQLRGIHACRTARRQGHRGGRGANQNREGADNCHWIAGAHAV